MRQPPDLVELVELVLPALLLADELGLPMPAVDVDVEGELDELVDSGVLAEALADGDPEDGDAEALAELDGEVSDDDVEAVDELDGGVSDEDDVEAVDELDGDDGAMLVELDELDGDDGVVVVDVLDELDGGLDGAVVVVAVLDVRSRSTVRSHAVRASALAIAREINIGLFIVVLLSVTGYPARIRRARPSGPGQRE